MNVHFFIEFDFNGEKKTFNIVHNKMNQKATFDLLAQKQSSLPFVLELILKEKTLNFFFPSWKKKMQFKDLL